MEAIARFYNNHGLLTLKNRPTWYYVSGGSHQYVKRFLEVFAGEVTTSCEVKRVTAGEGYAELTLADGNVKRFDRVVVATHADQALKLLSNPSPLERELLGAWAYSDNRVILHSDIGVMPPSRHAWASWNYFRSPGASDEAPATLTYHMNRLQDLSTERDYFVTLNPQSPIAEDAVVRELRYFHPMYDFDAIRTQARLAELNLDGPLRFCGSYFHNGFHEDGVRSAVAVAEGMGVRF
jgi:predicted NAD/FAD-binding protein